MAALAGAVHEAVWLAGKAALRSGRARSLPSPAVRHVTTIVRVPPEVAAALEPALERLRSLDPGHHYYPLDSVHVTLANLDRLESPLARVEAVILASPSLSFALGGLGLSPGTVLARVRPVDEDFFRLRRELRGLSAPPAGIRGRAVRSLLDRIAFANVVRFSGVVSGPFLAEIARLRNIELGTWTAAEVEVVETDRLLSQQSTRLLARIPLSGGA